MTTLLKSFARVAMAVVLMLWGTGVLSAQTLSAGSEYVGEPTAELWGDTLSRPVTGVYAIEIGGRSQLCEYLSPIAYSGLNIAASGHWVKAMGFAPSKVMMAFDARAAYSSMLNPAGSASTIAADLNFSWQMRRYYRLPYDLTVSIGGGPAIVAGATALMRNSNNPVSVNLKVCVELGASLSWRTRLGGVPLVIAERLSSPLLGAFFMTQYGETYYEIYLGNLSKLVHCGWPGNMPGIDNVVSVSFDFGRTSLSVGYRLIVDTAFANNLSMRSVCNTFVVGVIPDGLGLKRQRHKREVRPF